MKTAVFPALVDAAKRGEPVALGIISGAKGSSPQKVGAKALFYADGRIVSTLGGGCLEAEIQQRAIQSLHTDQASTFELLLDHDFGWDDGLICGGKVSGVIIPHAQKFGTDLWTRIAERKNKLRWGVRKDFSCNLLDDERDVRFEETVSPPFELWVAGAGHISQAVAELALKLDFRVSVFDDRPGLANHQFFPCEARLFADDWPKLLEHPFPEQPTFGLIVTRGHRHDALVLRNWIQKPFSFLGMIGSSRKARIIFDHFREENIATNEQLERIACPVGLDISSQTVQEIAVSIVAQLIQKRAELQ